MFFFLPFFRVFLSLKFEEILLKCMLKTLITFFTFCWRAIKKVFITFYSKIQNLKHIRCSCVNNQKEMERTQIFSTSGRKKSRRRSKFAKAVETRGENLLDLVKCQALSQKAPDWLVSFSSSQSVTRSEHSCSGN